MDQQTLLSIDSTDSDERPRGQTIGYVRVSSAEQNPARQFQARGRCDKIYEDRMSGKSRAKRTGLAELMGYVREHDTIRIASLDRLGRDTRDLHAIVDELTEKGCTVTFVSEKITVSKDDRSPMQELFLTFLSAMAQFERSRIRERQAEGIALAKKDGVYEKQRKLSDEDVAAVRALVDMGVSKAEVARRYGCSRQTLYSALAGRGVYAKAAQAAPPAMRE